MSDYGINTVQYRLIHDSDMIIYDNTRLIHVAMGDPLDLYVLWVKVHMYMYVLLVMVWSIIDNVMVNS